MTRAISPSRLKVDSGSMARPRGFYSFSYRDDNKENNAANGGSGRGHEDDNEQNDNLLREELRDRGKNGMTRNSRNRGFCARLHACLCSLTCIMCFTIIFIILFVAALAGISHYFNTHSAHVVNPFGSGYKSALQAPTAESIAIISRPNPKFMQRPVVASQIMKTKKPVTLDNISDNTFLDDYNFEEQVRWASGTDVFVGNLKVNSHHVIKDNAIYIFRTTNNSAQRIYDLNSVRGDSHTSYLVDPSNKFLVISNATSRPHWRLVEKAYYIVVDIKTKSEFPLQNGDNIDAVVFANLEKPAKSSEDAQQPEETQNNVQMTRLAYVFEHDLFIAQCKYNTPSFKCTEVCIGDSTNNNVIHGLAKGVYAEEIFNSNPILIRWAPGGHAIAWIAISHEVVDSYGTQFYTGEKTAKGKDIHYMTTSYPVPGKKNPTATLHVWKVTHDISEPPRDTMVTFSSDLLTEAGFNESEHQDILIVGFEWNNEDSLIVRIMNRVQNKASVLLVSLLDKGVALLESFDIYESENSKGGGWFEPDLPIMPIKNGTYFATIAQKGDRMRAAIYDTDPNDKGSSPTQRFLTENEDWDVVSIDAYDAQSDKLYILTTANGSSTRTPMVYDFNTGKVELLHTNLPVGVYSVSYSPDFTMSILRYNGPNIPYQTFYNLKTGQYNDTLPVVEKLSKHDLYDFPNVTMLDIDIGKFIGKDSKHRAQARLFLSSSVSQGGAVKLEDLKGDKQTKYPVLVTVYGGPGSQIVLQKFEPTFCTAMASSYDVACLEIDVTGSANGGLSRMYEIYKNMGVVEVEDVRAVVKWLQLQPWVDPDNIGVWGWSYGGYLACKIAQANTDWLVKFAVAVAPVTDWTSYDSFYTERYLGDDISSPAYKISRVNVSPGFNNTRFFIAHGTGDTNVHVSNTYRLVHELHAASIFNFDMHLFPDNGHSMQLPNSRKMLYYKIAAFIIEAIASKSNKPAEKPAGKPTK